MSIDWDIDSYKTEFETEEHWELRKRFMLAHKDKFPEDELVCLAQVFTNIEFMGCRYPEQTMKRVAYLARGVVEDFREKKKNCLKRTFVAASDAASAKIKGLKAHRKARPMPDPHSGKPKTKKKKIEKTNLGKETKEKNEHELKLKDEHQEVESMPDTDSGQPKSKDKEMEKTNLEEETKEENEPELKLEDECEEVRPMPDSDSDSGQPKAETKEIEKPNLEEEIKEKNEPELKLEDECEEVRPMPDSGQPKSKNKEIVKSSSRNSSGEPSRKEIRGINMPQLKLQVFNSLILSAIANTVQGLFEEITRKSILDNFVVLYFEKKENPLSIITRSVTANRCKMSWSYENANRQGPKTTSLYFNGELISSATEDNLKQCKRHVLQLALDKLKENCFGIRLNTEYRAFGVCDRDFVIRSQINGSNILSENNIGCRMMILMGWKGGGLGRREQGIIEPITLNMLAPREGFGVKSDINSFKKRAESFLRDWISSDSKDDLLFSSDFTAEERKELHLLAHSLSLKSKSQGKKNNRRLVISRSQHPLDIVRDLISAGGSTSKFDLVYPGKFAQNRSGSDNN